jgi:hypothetical protein
MLSNIYGDITITGEVLQNLLMLDVQGLWAPLLLWLQASVFQFSSEVPIHSVASYDMQKDV